MRAWTTEVLATFGRVPMFYYLLHITVIHLLALAVWLVRDGTTHGDWFMTAPYVFVPPDQRWSLPLLYLIFAVAVVVLYFPWRPYSRVKARGQHAWMRFL